jgi:hypothetical protein
MKARPINSIVVHCSASDWGSCDAIDKWHKARGWDGIGYHYVITNGVQESCRKYQGSDDGVIQEGRGLEKQGAHVRGHNSDSVGICLIGNYHFTKRQFTELKVLLLDLMDKHSIALERVVGHYELDSHKTCPNFDMDIVRDELRESITLKEAFKLVYLLTEIKKNE